ncbi:hypothetical protein D1007_00402 [Hordeum vulgare]|nr:hypothetical protein D1007_00402 [Hordeum vulgare]
MVGGFPNKGKAPLYPCVISPPSSSHRPCERVSVPVHQVRWHYEHRVPLPYPDAMLPHGWHLDPERIPVPAVPRLTRVHAEEVSRRRRLLTAEQWRYLTDEDQEAEAAYQAALAAVLHDSEKEARHRADEEAAYQQQLAEAIALSAAADCVMPPQPKPERTEPREVYQWTDVVQELVTALPIWLGATPQQDQV